ncbi:MAG: hypothetical protein EB168_05990 [Euryarchaeota archaeon]|nr:hypothetical protein [Euryarchaeota archaeon]
MAPKPKSNDRNLTPNANASDKGSEGPKPSSPALEAIKEGVDRIKGGGYQSSGRQPGLSGYYEYQPTYWDASPGVPEDVTYQTGGNMYQGVGSKSNRQDVWVEGGFYALNDDQKKLVVDASNTRGEYKVPSSWYDGTLKQALNISNFSDGAVTVEQALQAMIDPDILAEIESSGGRGGGGGRTITAPDDTQIRRIMDATSMNMVGRTLSDDEFDKYYKQYKNEYLSAGGNVDTQQLLTERVREEEDYQEMSVAKKFGAAMSNVLRGSL